jgi:hypothetical protein
MSPIERRREAHDAAHQACPHIGLQGGPYTDTCRERRGLQEREHIGGIEGSPDIDQKRPQDDPGPHPHAVHQECGQGNASGRPDRRRIPRGDGQEQGKLASCPIGRSDDGDRSNIRAVDSPGDVDMHAGPFCLILVRRRSASLRLTPVRCWVQLSGVIRSNWACSSPARRRQGRPVGPTHRLSVITTPKV